MICGAKNHHHHLVCGMRNRTIEFKEPFINGIGFNQAESEGYRLLDCQLMLYGTSLECELSNPSDDSALD
ncbi:MAG: transcriptional repressor [Leptolyngbyaceae cyanobacterium MO_188.B28]|nr:transcriptional repressor [Leptolyngbyaceae cyanobacterium MO_188.B28]